MDLIYHLHLFKPSWDYKSVGDLGPGCSIWFSLCPLPTRWLACNSCYNNRDSVSFRGHCHLLGSDYCYVIFPSTPVELLYNSLHGLLRFHTCLILLIHFNVFPSSPKHFSLYAIEYFTHICDTFEISFNFIAVLYCWNSVFFPVVFPTGRATMS